MNTNFSFGCMAAISAETLGPLVPPGMTTLEMQKHNFWIGVNALSRCACILGTDDHVPNVLQDNLQSTEWSHLTLEKPLQIRSSLTYPPQSTPAAGRAYARIRTIDQKSVSVEKPKQAPVAITVKNCGISQVELDEIALLTAASKSVRCTGFIKRISSGRNPLPCTVASLA